MSHPVIEIASAVAVTIAIAVGTVIVMPRPKPEPPPEPPVEVVTEATETRPATLRVRPLPEKTDAERIETLEQRAERIAAEQRDLKKRLDEAMKAEKSDERVQ